MHFLFRTLENKLKKKIPFIVEREVKFLACVVENSLRVVRKLEESQEKTTVRYLPGKRELHFTHMEW